MIYIIAENIKKHRKLKGYTQKQLGEKIGKSDMTVRKYESAYIMPSDSCLDDICKALEISRGDILLNEKDKKEMVNHPSHYNMGKYEAIDVIEDWELGFNLGNTIKYISRAGHKDSIVQDLKKAMWYLQREIDRIENK
jgi:transcriptional regulator with XRE-family HTH domain